MPPSLTPLSQAEPQAVEALLDAAFGADRRERTAYRLREGAAAIPALSFAAWDGERLTGTLQSWPVALSHAHGVRALVMVGPVAVAPDLQGTGIGRLLMDALIAAAAHEGADALMMIGDPDYYGRWGFVADQTGGWRVDGPYEQHRLLARLGRAFPSAGELLPYHRHSRESGNPTACVPAFSEEAGSPLSRG